MNHIRQSDWLQEREHFPILSAGRKQFATLALIYKVKVKSASIVKQANKLNVKKKQTALVGPY